MASKKKVFSFVAALVGSAVKSLENGEAGLGVGLEVWWGGLDEFQVKGAYKSFSVKFLIVEE